MSTAMNPVISLIATVTVVFVLMSIAQLAGQAWLKSKGKDSRHNRQGLSLAIVLCGGLLVFVIMTGHLKTLISWTVGIAIVALLAYWMNKQGERQAAEMRKPIIRRGEPKVMRTESIETQAERPRTKYMDKFQLLNKSEQALLEKLIEAAPALHVFCQVSMSQIFHIGNRRGSFQQLGEIGRKSVDFLLCRKDDTSIVVAIELNGPTHDRPEQRKSDEKKRSALEEAGIPLIVFYPDNIPDVATIRKELAPHIVSRRYYEDERDQRLKRHTTP